MKKHTKKKLTKTKSPISLHSDGPETHNRDSENLVIDPLTGYSASLAAIQGYQAVKTYLCPECNDTIVQGSPHLVLVPLDAPDLRRHWHNYCWVRRQNRTPGTKKRSKKR